MKLYITQIAKWLENKTGIPQQIIHTKEQSDIQYTDFDTNSPVNMTIIADADIKVKIICWSNEFGIKLITENNKIEDKTHVILWSDFELVKDDRGFYIDAEGAINGVLVIYNANTEVTESIVNEMLSIDERNNPNNLFKKEKQ